MLDMSHANLIIIGSGPAGYTAAIYAARALLKPVLISGIDVGGQLTTTADVENYPGFADVIQGPWLMDQMRAQAAHVGTQFVSDTVVELDLSTRPFRLKLAKGGTLTCDTVILATGAQARWLGLASEERFKGSGVSACATCDGFFFKDREVIVVGGGNTAVEDAHSLSHIASKVTVVHRRSEFRAERILQERLLAQPNVEVLWNHVVEDMFGEDGDMPMLAGAVLKDLKTGATTRRKADGLFVAIGHDPSVSLVKNQLELTSSGYVATVPGSTVTSIPGVFAAGDVTDEIYRQAVTAAGMGCMAALEAEKFLRLQTTHRIAAE
ncbi:MAG: thioredoxin-disulfide reductase [Rhizobiaceae bacterium]|nr:thioredoxin-disulfide reductase [Rhizobiaceae bacterium]